MALEGVSYSHLMIDRRDVLKAKPSVVEDLRDRCSLVRVQLKYSPKKVLTIQPIRARRKIWGPLKRAGYIQHTNTAFNRVQSGVMLAEWQPFSRTKGLYVFYKHVICLWGPGKRAGESVLAISDYVSGFLF